MRLTVLQSVRPKTSTAQFYTFDGIALKVKLHDSCKKYLFFDMCAMARRAGMAFLRPGCEVRKLRHSLRYCWEGREVTLQQFRQKLEECIS